VSYREAYLWGKPYKKLNDEQKETRDKLIKAFRSYKTDMADIENKEILLNNGTLSEVEKKQLEISIEKDKLRLMYLDNLIKPLIKKDKELIYYKYIQGLTHSQIVQYSSYYNKLSSIQARASRIIGILTLRIDPLIFKENYNE